MGDVINIGRLGEQYQIESGASVQFQAPPNMFSLVAAEAAEIVALQQQRDMYKDANALLLKSNQKWVTWGASADQRYADLQEGKRTSDRLYRNKCRDSRALNKTICEQDQTIRGLQIRAAMPLHQKLSEWFVGNYAWSVTVQSASDAGQLLLVLLASMLTYL